jgi:hypothetical protein
MSDIKADSPLNIEPSSQPPKSPFSSMPIRDFSDTFRLENGHIRTGRFRI